MSKVLLKLAVAGALIIGTGFNWSAWAGNYIVVGGYNRAIASFPFNQETGKAALEKRVFTSSKSSTDLLWCPNRSVLVATNELNPVDVPPYGKITSFKVKTLARSLATLSKLPTESDLPVSVEMTRDGRYLLVATSGFVPISQASLAVMPFDKDGKILPVTQKFTYNSRTPSHIQQAIMAPSGFVYGTDAGLGKIYTYAYLPDRNPAFPLLQVQATSLPPGFSPRDLVFSADGRFAYLSFMNQGAVMVMTVAGDGTLVPRTILPLDPSVPMSLLAGGSIGFSADGKFFYATARGPKNIAAVFAVNSETGDLDRIQTRFAAGRDTRGLAISGNGKYLAVTNRATNEVIIFRRNRTTGKLGGIAQRFLVRSPTTVMFINDKQ